MRVVPSLMHTSIRPGIPTRRPVTDNEVSADNMVRVLDRGGTGGNYGRKHGGEVARSKRWND